MDSQVPVGKILPSVEVVEACSEWFVRVVAGGEGITPTFELESIALAFAEGQRIHLGLDKVVRL